MISKKEYDAGINTTAQPWCMLSPEAKNVIRNVGYRPNSIEYMKTDGAWTLKHEITTVFNDGMIYRIHASTEHCEEGEVPACDIKGLKLMYLGTTTYMCFNVNGAKINVTRGDMVDLFGMQHNQQLMRDWFDMNQPKE